MGSGRVTSLIKSDNVQQSIQGEKVSAVSEVPLGFTGNNGGTYHKSRITHWADDKPAFKDYNQVYKGHW
jgi:hypothetical protein